MRSAGRRGSVWLWGIWPRGPGVLVIRCYCERVAAAPRRTRHRAFAALLVGTACVVFAPGSQAKQNARTPSRCLAVPPSLVRVLHAGLSIPSGATLQYPRAVVSRDRKSLVLVSVALKAPQLPRPVVATWAVDKLAADASIVAVDAKARAYSDWARPDSGASNISMKTDGAQASRRCVLIHLH